LVVIGCITLVAAGGWFTEQRLAFSFTSLLVNLTPGNGAQHGFRTECARSNNSSHTSLSAGCFIQHSTVERTCLPPLQTSCFTRVSLLKVVRHGTSGHRRRRNLEKRDSPLNQGGERSVEAQSHVIVDLKSIKSEPSVSDRLLNSTRD